MDVDTAWPGLRLHCRSGEKGKKRDETAKIGEQSAAWSQARLDAPKRLLTKHTVITLLEIRKIAFFSK